MDIIFSTPLSSFWVGEVAPWLGPGAPVGGDGGLSAKGDRAGAITFFLLGAGAGEVAGTSAGGDARGAGGGVAGGGVAGGGVAGGGVAGGGDASGGGVAGGGVAGGGVAGGGVAGGGEAGGGELTGGGVAGGGDDGGGELTGGGVLTGGGELTGGGVDGGGTLFVGGQNEDGYSLGSVPLFSLYRPVAEVWFHLKDAILEEGNLFEKVHGKSIFEYMDTDPMVNTLFSKAMAAHSGIAMKKVLETYKGFEGVSLLVDVAGGFGATLNMIISKYPSIKGINFDLPQVIKQAPYYPGIEHVEGDMFVDVPKGDAIVLKCTCHDWSDENCIKLLKNCNKALQESGKVIIIDYLMPEVPESSIAAKHVAIYDNAMVFNLGGKERTEKEFEVLSKSSGFSGFKVVCRAYNALGVMELYK